MLETQKVFKLKKDYKDVKAGTLFYKGELGSESGENDGELKMEFFEMTTEMESGHSYSYYGIPDEYLEPATETEADKVIQFLNPIKP